MGTDKALLEIGGIPLVVRTIRLVEPLVASAAVVGMPDRYRLLGLPVLADREYENRAACASSKKARSEGPLSGIAAALAASSFPWNLVLACDLPYLTRDWTSWLLNRALQSAAQAVIPRTSRGLEPLAGVYRRECSLPISEAFRRGIRKVTDALSEITLETISVSDWRHVDPTGRALNNMNTPEDYEQARILLENLPGSFNENP